MLAKNTHDKYRKNRRSNKCNKIQDLEKKRSQEGPRKVRKCRKNRKSNSILLLTVIINSLTFVTDDFLFAKMERIEKLLTRTYPS